MELKGVVVIRLTEARAGVIDLERNSRDWSETGRTCGTIHERGGGGNHCVLGKVRIALLR